jgi:AraC-like DNA-binding protein
MTLNIDIHSCQGRVEQAKAYSTLKPLSPLNHWVKEFWQLNVPDGRYFYRSVPDNCVDMIVNLKRPEEAFFVTPFSTAKVFEMTGPISYFGIRFNILGHQGIIAAPLGGWNDVDSVIDIDAILSKRTLNALYGGIYKPMSFQNRCNYFSKTLLGVLHPYEIDPRLMRYILYCNHNTTIDLSERQCSEFGVSARQLRRLTSQYLGLTPRGFAKTLRFQNTLQAINTGNSYNLWLNYYYDQPHFNRDFKNMSGVTPSEFKTMSVLYNTN